MAHCPHVHLRSWFKVGDPKVQITCNSAGENHPWAIVAVRPDTDRRDRLYRVNSDCQHKYKWCPPHESMFWWRCGRGYDEVDHPTICFLEPGSDLWVEPHDTTDCVANDSSSGGAPGGGGKNTMEVDCTVAGPSGSGDVAADIRRPSKHTPPADPTFDRGHKKGRHENVKVPSACVLHFLMRSLTQRLPADAVRFIQDETSRLTPREATTRIATLYDEGDTKEGPMDPAKLPVHPEALRDLVREFEEQTGSKVPITLLEMWSATGGISVEDCVELVGPEKGLSTDVWVDSGCDGVDFDLHELDDLRAADGDAFQGSDWKILYNSDFDPRKLVLVLVEQAGSDNYHRTAVVCDESSEHFNHVVRLGCGEMDVVNMSVGELLTKLAVEGCDLGNEQTVDFIWEVFSDLEKTQLSRGVEDLF